MDLSTGIAASSDGSRVFVAGTSEGDAATIAYDAALGSPIWTAYYDGPAGSLDIAWAIDVSPDGSTVFVTGSSRSSTGPNDVITVAYDANDGSELWVARHSGSGDSEDNGRAVSVSPDGSLVFVTGDTRSGSIVTRDYLTLAYNADDGTLAWEANYDGPATSVDGANSVAVSQDGSSVIVTGQSFGDGTGGDYATIAYDATNGVELWVARYDGPASGSDSATGLDLSADGASAFVTGHSPGIDTGNDFATVAYDVSTGDELWAARYDGPASDSEFNPLIGAAPDGTTVFITGQSDGIGTFDDFATIAYDATSGQELWVSRYDGPVSNVDRPGDIAISPDGNIVFVTGPSVITPDGQNRNIATIAYDASTGDELWLARHGDGGIFNDAAGLAVSPDGCQVFVASYDMEAGTVHDWATVAYTARNQIDLLCGFGLP